MWAWARQRGLPFCASQPTRPGHPHTYTNRGPTCATWPRESYTPTHIHTGPRKTGHTWACNYAHSPRRNWASTHVHTSTQIRVPKYIHATPRTPTKLGAHIRPPSPTRLLGTNVQGWRPRNLWALTHTDAPPRTLRASTRSSVRPRSFRAPTYVYGCSHIASERPHTYVESHARIWASARDLSWAVTRLHGRPRRGVYWAPTYPGGRPKIGGQSRTSGRPRHTMLDSHVYVWRLTRICGPSRTNMGAQDGDDWWPTHIGGRPKTATMGIHMLRVGAQGVGILDGHTHLRAPTRICVLPRYASGHPMPETWATITHLGATTYSVVDVRNIWVESHV